ncbi:hypothetical protein AMTR_s00142p00043860 [Amborella trichopoda]|uniref:Uncharacterized protein n=1 Tax=Amborella trichopoda TaxID=13333 RepID=W1PG20_AMBTC|nr:hypothetical protein AMTR_s00142p00043860 [Amborella trichopoda]
MEKFAGKDGRSGFKTLDRERFEVGFGVEIRICKKILRLQLKKSEKDSSPLKLEMMLFGPDLTSLQLHRLLGTSRSAIAAVSKLWNSKTIARLKPTIQANSKLHQTKIKA